jgi:NitT/TauT family transport system permease protein
MTNAVPESPAVAPSAIEALRKRTAWHEDRRVRTLLSILAGLALWEIAGRLTANPLFFVPPSEVAVAFWKLLQSGQLARDSWVSAQEFFIGFGLAVLIGIPLGILIATSRLMSAYVEPWMNGLYATPTIALAPLFLLWFGIDIWSKVAVVFLSALFPIVINTATGIESTDRNVLEAARSFNASRNQVFTKVLIPSAIPFIVAGMRLAVGRGIVGVVVGELFAARAGLGFLIITASQVFDTAGLFVGVVVLAVAGIVSMELLKMLERRIAPWREFKLEE